jgi:starch synthase
MEKLKILFASPEVVPFIKTGGLADVAGMLPRVLAEAGHEVKVALPQYSNIPVEKLSHLVSDVSLKIKIKNENQPLTLGRMPGNKANLEYLFIGNDHYFDRRALYVDPDTGLDYSDNAQRFAFFCRGILESLKIMRWSPDIIHANDWQSAMLPTYLSNIYQDDPFFKPARTIFTIHNLAYQGIFPPESFSNLGLDKNLFQPLSPLEFWGKVNFMKAAISYADLINTVSEQYAIEIQSSEEYGCGLEGVLRSRNEDLFGIINGVDYEEWSPAMDKYIPYKYSLSNMSGKKKTKIELINRLKLPQRETVPLIGIISRLADQKGFDLIALIAEDIFKLDIQMVVLGTGDKRYHDLFRKLEVTYPDKLKALLTYDNSMAHWIEAGADMFLMPSRYEPCGLNQLYSLRYGTPPIVRATGGLADTIDDVDEQPGTGTGFVFKKYDPEEMLTAIKRAVAMYSKKRAWRKIMKEGMKKDFSWAASARKYVDLYQRALSGQK